MASVYYFPMVHVLSPESIDDEVNELWLPGDHFSIIDAASDDWLVQLNSITDWL